MLCDEGSWESPARHPHPHPIPGKRNNIVYIFVGWLAGWFLGKRRGERKEKRILLQEWISKFLLGAAPLSDQWRIRKGGRTQWQRLMMDRIKKKGLFSLALPTHRGCRNPLAHSLFCARRWKIALDCVSCTVLFPRRLCPSLSLSLFKSPVQPPQHNRSA